MSNIVNSSLECPKCHHSPIMEIDTGHNNPDYYYTCKCGFTTENKDDFIVVEDSQSSPPTDRLDVEDMKRNAYRDRNCYNFNKCDDIKTLCDSYLELEKRLKKADKRMATLWDWGNDLNSLLADLVEAGEKYKQSASWALDSFDAALTAAKEYREKGKKE